MAGALLVSCQSWSQVRRLTIFDFRLMTSQSRHAAGILLVILPTVIYGGTAILSLLVDDPRYQQNSLRQDFVAGRACPRWSASDSIAGCTTLCR